MEITLFAYQFSPSTGEPMFFAETLDQCRAEALEQRADLKSYEDHADLAPFSIYECVVRVDVPTMIDMLNDPEEAVERALVRLCTHKSGFQIGLILIPCGLDLEAPDDPSPV
jgi:hypothetical protein